MGCSARKQGEAIVYIKQEPIGRQCIPAVEGRAADWMAGAGLKFKNIVDRAAFGAYCKVIVINGNADFRRPLNRARQVVDAICGVNGRHEQNAAEAGITEFLVGIACRHEVFAYESPRLQGAPDAIERPVAFGCQRHIDRPTDQIVFKFHRMTPRQPDGCQGA